MTNWEGFVSFHPQKYLCITISGSNVASVNRHIWSWEVPVPVSEYFPGQWSRFCGLGSKTNSYQAFLWNNYYNTVVLLNYCSIIYVTEVEPSRRWVEKGKKKVKETDVGFQNLSNVRVVWQGNMKCQEYNLRKIFTEVYPRYSLSFLFLILFFPICCRNFLLIPINCHSYFHEGICPLWLFHIGNHLLLFIDLRFYFFWDSFVNILLFGYSNITCLHIASLRKHIYIMVLNFLWMFSRTMIIFRKHISKCLFLFSLSFLSPS